MFFSPIEEQVRFAIDEHERLCKRLQLERAAQKAVAESRAADMPDPTSGHRLRGFVRSAATRFGTVHLW